MAENTEERHHAARLSNALVMTNEKFILDACCGGRMFWYNKRHPNALYIDNQPRAKGHIQDIPNHECKPDVIMDFTKLEFEDKKFKLIVWDPPHLKTLCETSIMRAKYGVLQAETWQYDLTKGFSECWRVLQDYGVLIFKWNEEEIPVADVIKLFKREPLFGHITGSKSKTIWLCFMKIPLSTP
jgi:hypothetical protein